MRAKLRAVAIVSASLSFSGAHPAAAQTPRPWQVSAGYSFMRVPNENLNFTVGWDVGTSVLLWRWLSIAADVDGHVSTIPSLGSDIKLTSHGFTAGARASARLGAFTEFGEALVGTVRSTGTLFGTTETTSHAVLQTGVGLDYPVSSRWAVRGELAARWLTTGHELRGVVGLVYNIH